MPGLTRHPVNNVSPKPAPACRKQGATLCPLDSCFRGNGSIMDENEVIFEEMA